LDIGHLTVVPLPNLIEIVPLDKPVHAEITVPGSKSITNRALVLAALAEGETTLLGALWSEDTQVMVECRQRAEAPRSRRSRLIAAAVIAVYCVAVAGFAIVGARGG